GPIKAKSGNVSPGASTGILSAKGDVSFSINTHFQVELQGTTAGSGYDQLNVTGAVSLAGATLQILSLNSRLSPPASFRIINNDGTDAVVGTFAGLAEGAVITMPTGQLLKITYKGGDGNDVVLIRIDAPALFPGRAVTSPIN